MNKPRSSRRQDGLCVYLEFHFPSVENFKTATDNVTNVMSSTFPDGCRIVHLSDLGQELIYRVQLPIMKDRVATEEFFYSLQSIFNTLSDYSPHFAQYSNQFEGDKNGK